MRQFNDKLALKLTTWVGSMWMAYAFCLLALVSLPATLLSGNLINIVAWIAQTFLQLVLLSVIMVGQNLQATKSQEHQEEILNKLIDYQKEEIAELQGQDILLNQEEIILKEIS